MIEIALLRDNESETPMELPFFKKPLSEATLVDLIKAGFTDLHIGSGEGEIWAKDNYRIIYEPLHDKVVRGYAISDTKVKPMSISEVNEILHYIDSHQRNTGSE